MIHSKENPFSSQSFPSDNTELRLLYDFHSQECVQFFDIHNCLFMRLHFSIGCNDYLVGLHDFVEASISTSLKSFLLIMCTDAPESTANSRSSSLPVDASKHVLFRESEECYSFWLVKFSPTFGQLPRCVEGTLLLPLCLLLRQILKIWSVRAALMRFTWAN